MEEPFYKFQVGIDFGTLSTSFSFAHINNEKKTITIKKWPDTKLDDFDERVPSSCLYEEISGIPHWGSTANMKPNNNDHLFYSSNIKLYLTDVEYQNQNPLPNGLDPIKLAADYLKQVHEYGLLKMKEYFNSKEPDATFFAISDSKAGQTKVSQVGVNRDSDCIIVDQSQFRYIISYPDNQGDGYTTKMRQTLEMAEIISPDDPPARVVFIPESKAVAHLCLEGEDIKRSNKPYIVCDVGDASLNISTINAFELSDTGTVETHTDHSSSRCGNIELDRNMRKYLIDKISASENDDMYLLHEVRERIFNLYVDHIKTSYKGDTDNEEYGMNDIQDISNSSIRSECFNDGSFVFSYQDMKDRIFDPVTNEILTKIQQTVDKFENGISGIFISGTIGDKEYLRNIVNKRFGKSDINIISIKESQFAVSRGLVIFGFREKGRMIPYYESHFEKLRDEVKQAKDQENYKTREEAKKINFDNVKYIVGLDFGTTYSGFAFAEANHRNDPNANHTFVIKEVKTWPGQKDNKLAKAPSLLYYNKNMENPKFGAEAKEASQRPRSSGILLRNFKLLLSRDFNPEIDERSLKKLEDFQVIDAIKDYLYHLNKKGAAELEVSSKDIGYIITIPAMWSDEAKNTMRVAVQKAGLVKKEDINTKVYFITEAEAAAMYCEKYYGDSFSMEKDQTFMICDAGGGTVDLVTFKVSQEDKGDQKFVISELTSGDGDNCGSIYLDAAFEEYILDKLEYNSISVKGKIINIIVEHFINNIKPTFELEVNEYTADEIKIPIPSGCGIPIDMAIPGFIEGDQIVIPYVDMKEKIFEPIVEKVLNLIETQLKKLNESDQQLDAILLVGGFGQSAYLHRRIKDTFENKTIGARFVGKPPAGHLAICKGAVSFGLQPRMVSEGITRYSYGLQVKDHFRKHDDDPEQKVVGYNKNEYCQNVFSPIIGKDSALKKRRVYVQKVFVTYPNDPVFAIYSTDKPGIPRSITDIKDYIIKISAKMPETVNAEKGDKVEFELWFELTGADINVDIYHDKKLLTHGVTKAQNIVRKKFTAEVGPDSPKKKNLGLFGKIRVLILPESIPKNT